MKHIQTDDAPKPGFYSQGVVVDTGKYDLLFTAGQTGNDPVTGQVASGGVYGQAQRALKNLLAVIVAAGGSPRDIAKVTVYLKDSHYHQNVLGYTALMRTKDREAFARAYEEFFAEFGINKEAGNLPARSFLWVSEVPLESPKEETVLEIDAVVAIPKK